MANRRYRVAHSSASPIGRKSKGRGDHIKEKKKKIAFKKVQLGKRGGSFGRNLR